MTRHMQRPTGQRSRRLNSKSSVPTTWAAKPGKKKSEITSTSTLLILPVSVSCFGEACGLN